MNWKILMLLAAVVLFVAGAGAPQAATTDSVDASNQALTASDEAKSLFDYSGSQGRS